MKRCPRRTFVWLVSRALLLFGVVLVVVATESAIEAWLPSVSAELAVAQLNSTDEAARSLRFYETLRSWMPVAGAAVIVITGIVLLVPEVGRQLRRFFEARD